MSGHQPVLQSQGKTAAVEPQQQQQPEPQAQTQFATYWPSYYAAPSGGSGGSGSSEGKPDSTTQVPGDDEPENEEREHLDREQRILRRKIANRESAKRSKQKRQQADRDLQEHARVVDDEGDTLATQVAAAQQRYWDAHAAHFELRKQIQGFAAGGPVSNEVDPSGGGPGGAGAAGVGDGGGPSTAAELGGSFGLGNVGGA